MTEKEMQTELSSFLEKKFRKARIINEYPFIHGTADILMQYNDNIYIFELKLKVSQRLFTQCLKHKNIADYIFLVSYLPKKNSTRLKWEGMAANQNLNLVWMEKIKKNKIKQGKKNMNLKLSMRKVVYGI